MIQIKFKLSVKMFCCNFLFLLTDFSHVQLQNFVLFEIFFNLVSLLAENLSSSMAEQPFYSS